MTIYKIPPRQTKKCFPTNLSLLFSVQKICYKKDIERFKQEYKEMQDFSSPYILEVYHYNDDRSEYIMEYMDFTLDSYISKYNAELPISKRKGIVQQILKAFEYIHSKNRLHRDISPKNILLKCYDDIVVVKISDFGLVKIPDSMLTSVNTEFKGYFNDPALLVDGFNTYGILHETFALTRLIYFVMTGKTNTENIADPKLVFLAVQTVSSMRSTISLRRSLSRRLFCVSMSYSILSLMISR